MKKVVIPLMVSLVGNTVSVAFLSIAFLIKHSLLGAVDFTQFVTLGMLNYLGGTLIAFIALGMWKRGSLLGKACMASGIENIVLGLLFFAILLQDVVKVPIVVFPFLTGYALIKYGKKAIALEKMEGGF